MATSSYWVIPMECVPLYDKLVDEEEEFDKDAAAAQRAGKKFKRQTSFWDGSTFATGVGLVSLFAGPVGWVVGGLTIAGSEMDRFDDISDTLEDYLAAEAAVNESALDYAEAWMKLCECGAREYPNR